MPGKPLEPLMPIAGTTDTFTARKGAARMCAARLKSGGLMLYSPIPQPDEYAIARANQLGGVEFIMAPSHFHNLGLAVWHQSFPNARMIAPAAAIPRLSRKTGFEFEDLSSVQALLRIGVKVLEAAGVKAGEAWLLFKGDAPALAVCDAFGCPAKPEGDPETLPKLRGAFKTMCLAETKTYTDWAQQVLQDQKPTRLFPAHGGSAQDAMLWQTLIQLNKDL